uniref:RRM domain-containing protein n=1 Tax=Kalanchoe fedtschenkoi TaxID=63787 RepID=A0A7N0U925_KALFE
MSGNLDERVSERVLYDILIQAGRVVDLYIPKDRETDRAKGFAFAEYETEEVADYAVKLFSGLVTLYNRTLRFAISGQDKPSSNTVTPPEHSNHRSRYNPSQMNNMDTSQLHSRTKAHYKDSEDLLLPPGVSTLPSHYRSALNGDNKDYSRRAFGETSDMYSRTRSGRYDY